MNTSLDVTDVPGHDRVRPVAVALPDRLENQLVIVAVLQSVPGAGRHVEGRSGFGRQIGDPYVFSDAEQRAFRERLWTPNLFRKTWDHYHSKL